jgi:excinuclease UvrABC nuclease subunit
MKMCLAPCFAGCTDEEYAHEVARVSGFLMTRGASLFGELSRERESASVGLDFERAAALHRRLEKVDVVRHLIPEVARPIENLDAVILQRAADANTVAAFVVRGGRIADPFLLSFAEFAGEPRSVEQILRNLLEPPSSAPDLPAVSPEPPSAAPAELEDHLALIARWFYARPRDGEIFFAEAKSEWPYRRMLRACSRLLAPQAKPHD